MSSESLDASEDELGVTPNLAAATAALPELAFFFDDVDVGVEGVEEAEEELNSVRTLSRRYWKASIQVEIMEIFSGFKVT